MAVDNVADEGLESLFGAAGVEGLEDILTDPGTNGEGLGNEPVIPKDAGNSQSELKDDKSRYQYWQSMHDKAKAELEASKAEAERLKLYKPIAEYFDSNPAALQRLEQELANPGEVADFQAEAKPKAVNLVRPARPQRPASYDANDALTDVNSDSAKYRVALEEYQEKLAEYMEQKEVLREQQERKATETTRQREQFRKGVLQARQTLMTVHKMNQAEANELLQMMADPKSLSLDSFVTLYKMKKAASKPDGKRNPNPSPGTLPLATQAGESAGSEEPTDEQMFAGGFKRFSPPVNRK
jgi:hypothetical protein